MFRLTREVRFAVNAAPDPQLGGGPPTNGHAGFPSLVGLGHYFALQVTLVGEMDPRSQYVRNIKEIDRVVRERAIPLVTQRVHTARFGGGGNVTLTLFSQLRDGWPGASLDALRLNLSPFLAYSVLATEYPMVRVSQTFEFSATHRLHNPALDEGQNRDTFGKCNNPHGHGHNYALQVTLAGQADENGSIVDIPRLERLVQHAVIDRFDHKNLNVELEEFAALIPSVENIAMTIYRILASRVGEIGARLASVTVWETPKTWCEYSE